MSILAMAGLLATAGGVVDLTVPTLASLQFHANKLEGDLFNQYADLDEWADGLAARFPLFANYATVGSIDNTTRPFFGRKTYNIPHEQYLELRKSLGQQYEPLWMRTIVFLPTQTQGDAGFDHISVMGMWDSLAANTEGYPDIRPVAQSWGNQNAYGNIAGDTPDVPFVSPVLGDWRTLIMRGSNPGGATLPKYSLWMDGVNQYADVTVKWATQPMPTTGHGVIDMYFGVAKNTGAGDEISMALWEVVPGANPYSLTLP